MKIIKIAGRKIEFEIRVYKNKTSAVVIPPGQNLGKKCDKLINAFPGEGDVEHNTDYNKSKVNQEQDVNVQETPQFDVL